MFLAFEERKQLIEEKQRLSAYLNGLKSILKRNPYLAQKWDLDMIIFWILHVADSFMLIRHISSANG